jgi:hypothetical protein
MISRQAFIATLLGVAFFLFVGVSSLFWPERIQSYALERSTSRLHQRVNPFIGWMKTRQYVWSLRVIGGMSVGAALLLLVILVRRS